jgi:hypothetical protein
MESDELANVAARLTSIVGDRCLLIGGLAVSAWGHIRATEDIDFVSSLEPGELQDVLSEAQIHTEIRRGDTLAGDIPWVVHGSVGEVSFQIIPPLVPIAWEKAVRVTLPSGIELRIVDLSDLIRLKLRAAGARDLWDVAVLLRQHAELRENARGWARELGCAGELDAWLEDPRVG